MRFSIILLVFCFTFFQSCDDKQKSAELDLREKQLQQKEKEFELRQAEYQELLKMRDSLDLHTESSNAALLPENFKGKWIGKIICTDSGCPENMIGDIRTDVWEFFEDGSKLSAKVTNKSGSERIYSGIFTGSEMQLSFKSDSTATKKTEINIVLNDIQENKIKGKREYFGDNNCVSKFSVELEKSKN